MLDNQSTETLAKKGDLLLAAVRASFPSPNFAVLGEVRDSTGHDAERAADAIALGLYRSRGRELWGFEFKASRADWLREIRIPAKAESWFSMCDHWGLVAIDDTVARPEEIPPGWGFGILNTSGKLKWIIKPPKLSPSPLTRDALTSLIYNAVQQEHRAEADIYNKAFADGQRSAQEAGARDHEAMIELRDQVNDFEKAIGMRLVRDFNSIAFAKTNTPTIAKAICALRGNEPDALDNIQIRLQRNAKVMEDEAGRFRERAAQIMAGREAMSALHGSCPGQETT